MGTSDDGAVHAIAMAVTLDMPPTSSDARADRKAELVARLLFSSATL